MTDVRPGQLWHGTPGYTNWGYFMVIRPWVDPTPPATVPIAWKVLADDGNLYRMENWFVEKYCTLFAKARRESS